MDILLVARDTLLNKEVRNNTNSIWGHVSPLCGDHVYEFDYKHKKMSKLSNIMIDPLVSRVAIFSGDGDFNEELYKQLFKAGTYDMNLLPKLRNMLPNNRTQENLQTKPNAYTCSNLIARAYFPDKIPSSLKNIHWSQAVPNDFSVLELKVDFDLRQDRLNH